MKKSLLLSILVLAFASVGAVSANAGYLKGWAWSENFGWISFNSADAGAGGGPYAVNVDSAGNWSGYAWSPYLGWIDFNPSDVASACPSLSAPSMPLSGGTVSGGGYIPVLGSPNGCLELTGSNHTLSFNAGTGAITGFAWDGDTTSAIGPGWIQFDPSTAGVFYDPGLITGTCSATTAYHDIQPNTSVTFQATPTSGTAPYEYDWNGSGYTTSNQDTITYPSSGAGPTVTMKDANGTVSAPVSCPNVVVATTNLFIGKTASSATTAAYASKKGQPFAAKWNIDLTNDYTCTTSVSPNTAYTNWASNFSYVDNMSNGTRTWSGDSGTALTANTAGIYTFGITCTSSGLGANTISTSATLKVNTSSENEI